MMHLRTLIEIAAPFAAAFLIAGCGARSPDVPPAPESALPPAERVGLPAARLVCPDARPGEAQCAATIESDREGNVSGWGPADIEAAYNLPSSSKGAGAVIAIVSAFDNPNVKSDLATYRSYYGLPPAVFTKYNQTGQQGNYPQPNRNWAFETDLDVEMASAVCPNCTLDLIEAKDSTLANMGLAVVEAVNLGAQVVSNSWGCYSAGCTWNTTAFDHAGVTYLAAAGDLGYGSFPPAQFANVVSVGGTVLSRNGTTFRETVWADTSGGCAPNIAKPSWQHDPGCLGRTANDVAAVAAGLAEYDTYAYGGWVVAGGTSAATPMIAGAFAMAGDAAKQNGGKTFWTQSKKKRKKDLHVIASGGVIACPPSLRGTYLCAAGTGQFGTYSGPTGWGTPNGIGAF